MHHITHNVCSNQKFITRFGETQIRTRSYDFLSIYYYYFLSPGIKYRDFKSCTQIATALKYSFHTFSCDKKENHTHIIIWLLIFNENR